MIIFIYECPSALPACFGAAPDTLASLASVAYLFPTLILGASLLFMCPMKSVITYMKS